MRHELPLSMPALAPPPDRQKFERDFKKLIDTDGDIETIARFLQVGRSNISRMYNPDCPDRFNPFWLATVHAWAFDAMRPGLADKALDRVHTERRMWLPAPRVISDPAKSTSRIGRELMEFIEKELAGEPAEVLVKEATDITNAVMAKIDEILAVRGLRRAAHG